MPDASDTLSARAVLEQAFALLLARFRTTAVDLLARAQAIIADETFVPHEQKVGYIGYDRAALATLPDGTRWVIGNGRKCGQYPGRFYDSDIAARLLYWMDGQPIEPGHLGQALAENEYFFHSPIVACIDGSFGVAQDSPFTQLTSTEILPHLGRFVTAPAVLDPKLVCAATMRPRIAKPATYAPDIAPFLADTIVRIMEGSIDLAHDD